MSESGVRWVEVDEHVGLVTDILTGLGAPEEAARWQAQVLLEGDLRGHPSHGLRRIEVLAGRIRRGLAVPDAKPRLEWRTPAALAVDGQRGLGPPTAARAVDALLERLVDTGVAVAAIRDTNHLGMLAPYVERLAADGVVGLATTTSEALVHPWGGIPAMVGTNPLAVAVPSEEEPVVLDMATGEVSMGKVLDHEARGEPLPQGSVVDARGVPTSDPAEAVKGAISPFGGAKGYALAVTLEVLVASLTGTALGRDVRGTLDATDHCNKGDVLLAIDPAAFGQDDRGPLQRFVEELRSCPVAPGHERVTVPGDRARERRRACLGQGAVPIAEVTWERAVAWATEVGASPGVPRGEEP
ncbi:Ldh family oxidoreductase [Egibacter rhizosphaerae]|uniref:Ldh family oxidoreductase n=1 Tax=Egibacter rhizosphaerae TaxID=1670831 RepID=A0A411YBC0_9ACTN|nr:Ldh family oxidoreductase [Egibacter rhizosphaerae]QBI18553.1 Ldh family oxidoreductase [Egibacter rhizosphaerae]